MNYILLIFLLAVVTYLPRMLPFYIFDKDKISYRFRKILNCVPYAALGALIIPGGFNGIKNQQLLSVAGLLIAIVVSYFQKNIILTMVITLAILYPFA